MMKSGLRGLMEANLSFTFHSYRKENTQLNTRNHGLSVPHIYLISVTKCNVPWEPGSILSSLVFSPSHERMCLLGSSRSRPHISKSLRGIVIKFNHDHHVYLPRRSRANRSIWYVFLFPCCFSLCLTHVSASHL